MTQPGPELVVHLFIPSEGPLAAAGYDQLRELWESCSRELSIRSEIANLKIGSVLPSSLGERPASGAIAAKESEDGDFQVILRQAHDLLLFSAVFQATGGQTSWQALDDLWSNASRGLTTRSIGEVRLYQRYHPNPRELLSGPHLHEFMLEQLPTPAARSITDADGVLTASGFLVIEPDSRDDLRRQRRLVIVAAPEQEHELSAWTWTYRRDLRITPLHRYLGHAAKVRFQRGVWNGGQPVKVSRERLDLRASQLAATLATGGLLGLDGRDGTVRGLVESQVGEAKLARQTQQLRADTFRLATLATSVVDMRRTVEIARHNMSGSIEPELVKSAAGPFRDDADVADHLVQLLDDEFVYTNSALARARELLALVDLIGPLAVGPISPEPADPVLTPAARDTLLNALAAAFRSQDSVDALFEDIGIDLSRLPTLTGISSTTWWRTMFRLLDSGLTANPYSKLLAVAQEMFPANPAFISLSAQYGPRR